MEKLDLKDYKMVQPETQEYRPDLMLIKNADYIPNYALFGIEFTLENKINESYRGNVHSFNTRVLEFDSSRCFIVSLITNLRLLRLVISEKEYGSITHKNFTVQLDFWTVGLKLIQIVHNNPSLVGYDIISSSIEINRYI